MYICKYNPKWMFLPVGRVSDKTRKKRIYQNSKLACSQSLQDCPNCSQAHNFKFTDADG